MRSLPTASLALASLTLLAPLGAAQTWQFVSSSDGSTPAKRHEAAMVEFGGKFYLMGGRGSRPVNEFDPVSETWIDLGNPPLQMHHFQPVVWGAKVYVVCAFEGNYPSETPVPDVWTYDPPANTWASGSPIPPARNRGAAGVVVYGDNLYVVGGNTMGHDGGYVPWFDRYDPATDTWTQLSDAPHARDHFTAAVIGNKLYAAGGRQTEQPNPFLNTVAPVDVYDFTSGNWSSMPEPLPTLRAGTMTVARGEHLIVVGGESSSEAHDETEALDTNTGEWLSLPLLNQGRHSGGAVLHQDAIYVAAGAGSPGGSPELNTLEKLVLTTLLGPSPTNLLTNGDFDSGQTGWEDHGDLTLSTDGGIDEPALDIANGWTAQNVAATAQETYTLRALYKTLGTPGTAVLALEFLDTGGVKIGEVSSVLTATGSTTSVDLKATTPTGTATLRLRCQGDGGLTLRIDDLVLIETPAEVVRLGVPGNPAALPPTGSGPTTGQTWAPTIDHTSFAPSAILDVLGVGFIPLNVPTSIGTLLLSPTAALVFTSTPGAPFGLPVPSDAALVGSPLVAQGAAIGGGSLALTNALDLTIQTP